MNGYSAEIIADSVSNESASRLTTFVLRYPRFVHAELMTHRMLSKNSSSSRAIPNSKMIENIMDDPVMPVWWGKNQKGMKAAMEIDDPLAAEMVWNTARNEMLGFVRQLANLGAHKQIVNRLLEPWMYITVVVTGTDFENFFHLRTPKVDILPQHFDPDFPAQPEIQKIAHMMWQLYTSNKPTELITGEWHLPFVTLEERQALPIEILKNLSVARCARVSYLTHDGEYNIQRDKGLAELLSTAGHWSPFEHQAVALQNKLRVGNLLGWKQYRKFWHDENYVGF